MSPSPPCPPVCALDGERLNAAQVFYRGHVTRCPARPRPEWYDVDDLPTRRAQPTHRRLRTRFLADTALCIPQTRRRDVQEHYSYAMHYLVSPARHFEKSTLSPPSLTALALIRRYLDNHSAAPRALCTTTAWDANLQPAPRIVSPPPSMNVLDLPDACTSTTVVDDKRQRSHLVQPGPGGLWSGEWGCMKWEVGEGARWRDMEVENSGLVSDQIGASISQ